MFESFPSICAIVFSCLPLLSHMLFMAIDSPSSLSILVAEWFAF